MFSNLVMNKVTGPISIGLHSAPRRGSAPADTPRPKGIVRNLTFTGIRATVVAEGKQHDDLPFPSSFRPGEAKTCIVLNGVENDFLEGITFSDIHVTFEGGGTAEEAGRRDIPKMAGEYFELGVLPAYGMFARNVRGLTFQNVRFEVAASDLRPAVVLDHASDVAVNGFGAQGNPKAAALIRCVESQDVLLSACRVLTPAAVFLQVEGAGSKAITIDGGDLSKAAVPLAVTEGATKDAVRLRV
jgi:hypothetical protein